MTLSIEPKLDIESQYRQEQCEHFETEFDYFESGLKNIKGIPENVIKIWPLQGWGWAIESKFKA